MRELNFNEIQAISGSNGYVDAVENGAVMGTGIGALEAAVTRLGGSAAAGVIGGWAAIGGAVALVGYTSYRGATALGADRLGSYLGEVTYDYFS